MQCKLCPRPILASGFCNTHYLRWWKYGNPHTVLLRRGEASKDTKGYMIKWVNGKCVKVHRIIMEEFLGRKLQPFEHVHHINGDRADNRIENLEVIHIREHNSMHTKQRWAQHRAGLRKFR